MVHLAQPVYECLKSLVERTPGGHYEVIVVDNTGGDHMQWVLAHFAGVRTLRNEGFQTPLESLNQGAREAAGRFLLLLTPDTLLLDGWLPPLVETLVNDASVGAVGPKLIGLDGALHQAGRILWSDGFATDHGRGGDPHRPEYLYRREVDAGSATCLLVRRQLFSRAGGLDAAMEDFADLDLALALRALGQSVVYQPRSQVVRLDAPDAGSAGASSASGVRDGADGDGGEAVSRVDVVPSEPDTDAGRRRFVAKHSEMLAGQYLRDFSRIHRARSRRPGLRIAIVDHMVPAPDRDAGSVRMLAMLELLAELGHHVTFIPDNLTPAEPYTARLQEMGVEVLFGDMSIVDYVAEHSRDIDLVILCRATIAGKYMTRLAAHPSHPAIVFDTVDLHFLREERHAALLGDAGRHGARRGRQGRRARAGPGEPGGVGGEPVRGRRAPRRGSATARGRRAPDPCDPPGHAGICRPAGPDVHRRLRPSAQRGRRPVLRLGGVADPDAGVAGGAIPRLGADPRRRCARLAGAAVDRRPRATSDPLFDRCRVFVARSARRRGSRGRSSSLACGLPVVTTSVGAEGSAWFTASTS